MTGSTAYLCINVLNCHRRDSSQPRLHFFKDCKSLNLPGLIFIAERYNDGLSASDRPERIVNILRGVRYSVCLPFVRMSQFVLHINRYYMHLTSVYVGSPAFCPRPNRSKDPHVTVIFKTCDLYNALCMAC